MLLTVRRKPMQKVEIVTVADFYIEIVEDLLYIGFVINKKKIKSVLK